MSAEIRDHSSGVVANWQIQRGPPGKPKPPWPKVGKKPYAEVLAAGAGHPLPGAITALKIGGKPMKRWLLSKLGLARASPHRDDQVDVSSYEIVSAAITMGKPEEEEPIAPAEIRHDVDEIFADGKLKQHYNYIDYHFEKYGAYCRARTYLDDIETASFYGPFGSREETGPIEAPELYQEVLAYLKRRFKVIKVLGDEGYEELWRYPGFEQRY